MRRLTKFDTFFVFFVFIAGVAFLTFALHGPLDFNSTYSAVAATPVEVFQPALPPPPDPGKTILFAGDIMLGRLVAEQIQDHQDPLYPFLRIADVMQKADLAFANLEGPISDNGSNQGSLYSFRFDPVASINALKFAGFDALSVANNHIWDWGAVGLIDTVTLLNQAGISPVGAGNNEREANAPVIYNLGDSRVAFLGYTNLDPKSVDASGDKPGISHFDLEAITHRIQELKTTDAADIVIVSFHGGEEYHPKANASQKEIAHALIDAGADLFIGTHPHVVEEVEQYHNGWIAYSLGNFVFDQDFSQATMAGLMVRATIQDKKVTRFEQIPIKINDTFQPYIFESSPLF